MTTQGADVHDLFNVGDTAVDDVLPLREWNMRQTVARAETPTGSGRRFG